MSVVDFGRPFFETLTNTFEVADKRIEVTEGFERTDYGIIGQERRERNRDITPPPDEQQHDQQMYTVEKRKWLKNDFLDSTHPVNRSDFQAELLQSSDIWRAAANLN